MGTEWLNRARLLVNGVVFNRSVYATIGGVMAYRIFYTPQDPYNDDGGDTFITLEVMVTVFFSLELLIRMVAGGTVLSRTGFFAW